MFDGACAVRPRGLVEQEEKEEERACHRRPAGRFIHLHLSHISLESEQRFEIPRVVRVG